MSAVGAWLAKLVGAVGGAPMLGALVVGGLVVGALGGAFAGGAFGRGTDVPAEGELAIYPCPDAGPIIAKAGSGQHVLVTGRSADGAWLRIHFPAPGKDSAWVRADKLHLLQGAIDSVEVAECDPEVDVSEAPSAGATLTVVGSFVPTPSPTPEPTPTPTPSPTPTPTPTPTPKPATPKPPTAPPTAPPPTVAPTPTLVPTPTPTLGPTYALSQSSDVIMRPAAVTVPCGPSSSLITAIVTDSDTVDPSTVLLHYTPPGLPTEVAQMTTRDGTTFIRSISSTPNWSQGGTLTYYVTASDKLGNSSTSPTGSIGVCPL